MPHNKQARKRLRQDVGRRLRNKARRSAMKTQIKKTREVLQAGDLERAKEMLRQAMSKIDRAAKAHVIHKNTAARKKSALSRQLLELETGQGVS